jgi:two-component system nitrogen regulation response regulator NtrX
MAGDVCKTNQLADDLAGADILLVDDEQPVHEIVQAILGNAGVNLTSVTCLADAMKISGEKKFDAALVDMILPDGHGIELIKNIKKVSPQTSVIVITGYADRDMAWDLESASVQSVLIKPFSAAQLRFTICKELARQRLIDKEGMISGEPASAEDCGLTGNSSYIKSLRKKIRMFAAGNLPILIHGPTGTGKEIIAAAIHANSIRSPQRMVIVNSSAVPEALEESEFFGHARGAFTGAHDEKEGFVACADNSSLFLDEVGELSLRMQAKLLRVLDGHEYTRVGDVKPRRSDFRLISATNRDLTAMIAKGTFRQDLYYRLSAGEIITHGLFSHAEDIPLLVRRFLYDYNTSCNRKIIITREALDALAGYEWPGNIREIKNAVNSLCMANSDSGTITSESIEWVILGKNSGVANRMQFTEAKRDFEEKYYRDLLARNSGNITACAREANLDRPNFSKKLKLLGIDAGEYRE